MKVVKMAFFSPFFPLHNFAIKVAPTAKFVREKWSFCFSAPKNVIKMLI